MTSSQANTPIDVFGFLSEHEGRDPLGDFFEHAANGPLLKLAFHRQHGVHEGQTLYSHLLNVALMADLIARLVGCTELERRIVICAAVLHDLNKLDDKGRPIWQVANTTDVERFIVDYGLAGVLPEYKVHLEAIRRLVAGHSGHYHQAGDALFPLDGPVDRARVDELLEIVRAADQVEVARRFDDSRKRAQVLGHINAVSGVQYRWEWHRLAEHRGVFTNLLHNATIAELEEQLGARAVVNYAEGTFYLVPAAARTSLDHDTHERIARRLRETLRRIKGRKADEFVKGSPTGIKIDQELFATELTIADAFSAAALLIERRRYPPEAIEEAERRALGRAGDGHEAALCANGHLYSRDENVMRAGELLRVAYNFLQKHCTSLFRGRQKQFENPWQAICQQLGLAEKPGWEAIDPLNDRAYVIARDVLLDFGELLDQLTQLADRSAVHRRTAAHAVPEDPAIVCYIQENLTLSMLAPDRRSFLAHVRTYIDSGVATCALCSAALPAEPMMANTVPSKLAVAQFSNRNVAGTGDPKRNSCSVCREQLLVERLGFAPAQRKHYYLHLYPETFAPPPLLDALRAVFRRLRGEDVQALLLDTRQIARRLEHEGILRLTFRPLATGVAVPAFSELIGNVITLPLYALGNNETERYLFALQYALLFQARLGLRAVLTQSAIAPVSPAEMGDRVKLYLDDLPGALGGLAARNAFDDEQAALLFAQVHDLKVIADRIGTGEDLVDLVRALGRGELGVFFAAYRALARRKRKESDAHAAAGEIADRLVEVARRLHHQLTGEPTMSDISRTAVLIRLAELAWRKTIRGQTLTDSSLIKPMELAFQLIRRQKTTDPDYLKLAASGLIYKHLERTSDYEVSVERAAAVDGWVSAFFDELLGGAFGGNAALLLRDEKYIKAAYITLMRRELRRASQEKKAREQAAKRGQDDPIDTAQ